RFRSTLGADQTRRQENALYTIQLLLLLQDGDGTKSRGLGFANILRKERQQSEFLHDVPANIELLLLSYHGQIQAISGPNNRQPSSSNAGENVKTQSKSELHADHEAASTCAHAHQ
ncbi:hypothetical protein GBF38_002603, partial [Nibea albiflora]